MPPAMIENPVERGEKPRPPSQIRQTAARSERVERAGLDQAFKDLLVHESEIDLLGQFEERVDPAAQRLSSREDRLNRALTRALDRPQAKPHAIRLDRER